MGDDQKILELNAKRLAKASGLPEKDCLEIAIYARKVNRIRKVLLILPEMVDMVAKKIKVATSWVFKRKLGQIFLGLSLLSPFSFIPTVWQAWTASNIDGLKTSTWPLLLVANLATLILLCQEEGWLVQLNSILWALLVLSVWLATLIR